MHSGSNSSTSTPGTNEVVLPIGVDDEQLIFPAGRHAGLPDMYIQSDHPLHVQAGLTGRAIYYIQDGSPSGMEKITKLEHWEMEVPSGGEQEALDKGFLKLLPGDVVYARLTSSSSSGMDDVAVCWLSGGDLYSDELRHRATEVRDRILGPRELRTRNMPVGTASERTGGTLFERDFPPDENVRGGRCYPFGTSLEFIPKYYAPCAQGKRSRAGSDVLSYRSDLLKVSVDMASLSLLAGPKEIGECLRLNHELLNIPSIGTSNNTFFGACQLNIAPANRASSASTLGASLGTAGTEHIDSHDSPAHYTTMICASDLPPGYDPGRFFILYPGVFYEQGDFVSFCFSGLRRHGGTPPVAPADATEEELQWPARVTIVVYPPGGSVTSTSRRILCADGIHSHSHFDVSPEMTVPEGVAPVPSIKHATFAQEGDLIMSRECFMDFMSRSLLQMATFVTRQIPQEVGVRVDSDALLASFSFLDEEGDRRRVGPWINGPGWRNTDMDVSTNASGSVDNGLTYSNQTDHIRTLHSRWERFAAKQAGHIPYAVSVKSGVRAIEGWDSDNIHKKMSNPRNPANKDNDGEGQASTNDGGGDSSTGDKRPISSRLRNLGQNKRQRSPTPIESGSATPSGKNSKASTPRRPSKRPRGATNSNRTSRERLSSVEPSVSDTVPSPPSQAAGATASRSLPPTTPCASVCSTPCEDRLSTSSSPTGDIQSKTPEAVSTVLTVPTPSTSVPGNSSSAGLFPASGADLQSFEATMQQCKKDMENLSYNADSNVVNLFTEADRPFSDAMDKVQSITFPLQQDPSLEELMDQCNDRLEEINIDKPGFDLNCLLGGTGLNTVYTNEESAGSSIPPLPGYLRAISPEVVYSELVAVQTGGLDLVRNRNPNDDVNPVDLAFRLNIATEEKPFEPATFDVIRDTRLGLDVLLANQMQDYLKLKHLRSCIMLSNRASWLWLEDKIPSCTSIILNGNTEDCPLWLVLLVDEVKEWLTGRRTAHRFTPGLYGINAEGLKAATLDIHSYPYKRQYPESLRSYILKAVHDIVAAWLDFPLDGDSYWRAIYVDILYQSVGIDATVLDVVWNTYTRLTKDVIGSRYTHPLPEGAAMSDYELFNRKSLLRKDLRLLSRIIFAFADGSQSVRDEDNEELGGDTVVEHLEKASGKRLEAFQSFVKNSYYFQFKGRASGNPVVDTKMREDGDRYMPFRENAPTRLHLTRPGGPFSPEHVRTVEGLFSAIVNRAITFNTPFSRKGRTLFKSPEDFYSAVDDFGCVEEEEYCDKKAYGKQSNSNKRVELAEQYWDAVTEDPPWPVLTATAPVPFIECFNYFYPSSGKSKFHQIGKLASYLLTADYVYAGVVEPPPLEVITKIIKQNNKGPVSALELLSKASPRTKGLKGKKRLTKSTIKELAKNFEAAFQALKSSIPAEAHQVISVDYILTEHALCKFSRFAGGRYPVLRMD